MPTSFYDVVVLGTHLEPLLCAALLGREGLRVLVVDQSVPEPFYALGEVDIEPYGLIATGVNSPVVQSALDLLALRQDVRQHLRHLDAPLQLLLPDNHIDVHRNPDRWLAEIQRELPSVGHHAADITRTLGEVRAELDMVVGRELIWPPESFLERQRMSFVTSAQRYDRHGHGWTSWNQLAHRHPLRHAFEAVLPHVSGLLPRQHSDATRARLHGHILEGTAELQGGWRWLQEALFSRIRSWGGDVRRRERAASVHPHRRKGHTLTLARTGEEIGCSQVVLGVPIDELSRLLPDRSPISSLFDRVGEPRARAYRCSVHVLVEDVGVPEALGPIGLLCTDEVNPARGFLVRRNRVSERHTLLSTSTLVDEHRIDTNSSPLGFVREEAMDALRTIVPFLDDYVIWIDSPHDGLPPSAVGGASDLASSEPWSRGPHTMRAVYEYPTRRALGVCALPTRTPVHGLFLCNEQVAPGLGFEGSFLAATSVARLVAGQYKRQDWLRRGPWSGPRV